MPRVTLVLWQCSHYRLPARASHPSLVLHSTAFSLFTCARALRHLCRRSLPRLFPWAFSLTTQVPVQVSLFLGLPEHGSRPSFTAFVCWVPISHLRPTTRTQTLSKNLWCIPSTTAGHLQPSTCVGYIMIFKFLLNKKMSKKVDILPTNSRWLLSLLLRPWAP